MSTAPAAGQPLGLPRVRRRRSPRSSTFAVDEVDVVLEDGTELGLVAKGLSAGSMLETARRVRPDFLVDPGREAAVYRSVLRSDDHGTARYHGVCVGDVGPVLLLERVEGVPLEELSWGAAWRETACWLAAFHREFATGEVACESSLIAYDRAYFALWPERALHFAARSSWAARRLADVTAVARRYGAVADALAELPTTLVHGDCHPSNVIIVDGNRVRVCLVDWEMAGRGPALLDLAALTAGDWPVAEMASIVSAYGERFACGRRRGERPLDDRELQRGLDLCRLHLAMQWLGWAPDWVPEDRRNRDWASVAVACAQRLGL